MRILLIAPDTSAVELNTTTEIRRISTYHSVMFLSDTVTVKDVYEAAEEGEFDIIHFATHVAQDDYLQHLDRVMLSNGETLTLQDVLQVSLWCGARMVFFNVCLSARFAAYLVRHGVPCAIYATVAILDEVAWKVPMGLYAQIAKHERSRAVVDFKSALLKVVGSDGKYSINTNGQYHLSLIEPIQKEMEQIRLQIQKVSDQVALNSKKLGEGITTSKGADWSQYAVLLLLLVLVAMAARGNLF